MAAREPMRPRADGPTRLIGVALAPLVGTVITFVVLDALTRQAAVPARPVVMPWRATR